MVVPAAGGQLLILKAVAQLLGLKTASSSLVGPFVQNPTSSSRSFRGLALSFTHT